MLCNAVQIQKLGRKKKRGRGRGRYLELIGFLNDDFKLGVLPQDRAPHLGDSALFLLLASQWLLFFALLCKAKSPSVSQAWVVTLWSWLPVREGGQEASRWERKQQSSWEGGGHGATDKVVLLENASKRSATCPTFSESSSPSELGNSLSPGTCCLSRRDAGGDRSSLRLLHFPALQVCVGAWSGHFHQPVTTRDLPAASGLRWVWNLDSASFWAGLYLGNGAGSWRAWNSCCDGGSAGNSVGPYRCEEPCTGHGLAPNPEKGGNGETTSADVHLHWHPCSLWAWGPQAAWLLLLSLCRPPTELPSSPPQGWGEWHQD